MASRKKNPSFDIPPAVREAGQSGWVYRTGEGRKPRRSRAPRDGSAVSTPPAAPAPADIEGAADRSAEALPSGTDTTAAAGAMRSAETTTMPRPAAPPVVAEPAIVSRPAAPNVARRLIDFGLHVAAVPFVVPLYLTAAVSRRLGTDQP